MEKLVLERKIEDLLNRDLYPMLKKFPKAEKFALCQEIKKANYEMLRLLNRQGNSEKSIAQTD